MRTKAPDSKAGGRPHRLVRLRRRLTAVVTAAAALVLGPQAAMAHAAGEVKVNTGGLEDLLVDNLIPIGILIGGLFIILGARKKDWSAAATQAGIVLLGVGVIGMAAMSTGIGDALVGMVTDGG